MKTTADHYVWFIWASSFLVPWAVLFVTFPAQRRAMWWASIFTLPLGLTEPLFVPKYWNPPSLFNLAQRTGFDIESLIFCFAIGGVAAVLYNALTGRKLQPVDPSEKRLPLHRHHYLALGAPVIAFIPLYFLPWNPIYTGIVSLFIGWAVCCSFFTTSCCCKGYSGCRRATLNASGNLTHCSVS
jgi:hypothetical protein